MRCLPALLSSLVLAVGLGTPDAVAQQSGDQTDSGDLPSATDILDGNDEAADEDDQAVDEDDEVADEDDVREAPAEPDPADDEIRQPGVGPDATEGDVEVVERPDEQLVILDVRLPEFRLTRDMIGYYDQQAERLWLPLWLFVDLTEIAIDVDIEEGYAEGWIHEQQQTFELDLAEGTVTLADRTRELAPGDAELHYDDIYVDIERLAEWLSFDWEFDFSKMELQLDPDPLFPPQRQLLRERRRERIEEVRVRDEPRYDVEPHPYQLWSRPVHEFDVGVGFPSYLETQEREHRRRTVPQSNHYQIRGAGDLLYMNANWSIAGSERHPIRRTRLRFDRKDPDGQLLGAAEATDIRAGDILSPNVPMIAQTDRGRGVQVSNFPLTRPSAFDETTISGPRQPGWEIELYRNDELIDYREPRDDDYYYFENVPLLFGSNEIRVVQYGPHGQEHEDVYRYQVGPDMISPGEDHYRVSLSQHNTEMLPITQGRRTSPVDGRPRAVVEYERGINERVAVAGRASTLPMRRTERQRLFSTLGVRNAFSRAYTSLDLLVSDGLGVHGAVQTRIGEYNVSAESAQFFGGFTSEQLPFHDSPLRNRTRLRLNGVIPAVEDVRLPFSLNLQNDYRSNLGHQSRLIKRLSAHFADASVMHDARLRRRADGTFAANGVLSVRRRQLQLTPRAGIAYNLEQGLRSYRLGLDWGLTSDLEYRSSIVHQFRAPHDLTIRQGLYYRRDGFNLQGNLGISESGGVSVGVGVSWGIAHNPMTDQWEPTSERLTTTGRVAPRVFVDHTQTGVYAEDFDEPLEEVRFDVNGATRDEFATDDDGLAVLQGVRPHEYADIRVDRASLPDPFLVPDPEGYSIASRPGAVARLELPVTMTGEIDGTVRLVGPDRYRPAQNFTVQLVDEAGEVVDETRTAFDGFYLFDFVPPGEYTVRVEPRQLEARNLREPDEHTVEIEGDGTIAAGRDFDLEQK